MLDVRARWILRAREQGQAMTWGNAEVREFLRARGALLVHFSTVMNQSSYRYPADLQNAWGLSAVELSFSTIQPGDSFRFAQGGRGGAEGSVGMIVDLGPNTTVGSVHPGDSGSSAVGSLGSTPSPEACASSIDDRVDGNEWRVSAYRPIGILVLGPPIFIRRTVPLADVGPIDTDVEITFNEVLGDFPGKRIFTLDQIGFKEWKGAAWEAVSYNDIVPA
jgi:hypothetical protein